MTTVIYETSTILDHSLVIMRIIFPDYKPLVKTWRLNTRPLTEQRFIDFINTLINLFFKCNASLEISYNTPWDTFKAYIIGKIISYSASDRKRKPKCASEISDGLKTIDHIQSFLATELWYVMVVVVFTLYA